MIRYIDLDADTIGQRFPVKPFAIKHKLVGHELFALARLVELGSSMDRDRVEYSSGKVAPGQKPEDVPAIGLSIPDTIRHIEDCGAWMVIKNVETVPEYRALLLECLDEVAAQAGPDAEKMHDPQAFIFISSAKTVTPFHVDAEQNFLIQIKGRKFMHVFNNDHHELVSEEAMEISPAQHRNRDYKPEFEKRATVFELNPGDGVFVPYLTPHWVRTGDEYCISIAVTWKTPSVLRHNRILAANGLLRKFGLPQSPPGTRPVWDGVKSAGYACARVCVEPLRRSERLRRWLRAAIYGKKANYYYES